MINTFVWTLFRTLGVLLVVTAVVFALMYGNGEGIARSVVGFRSTDEGVMIKMVELGLDRPLLTQFWDWGTGAARGDLGRSFYTGQSVAEALSQRVPVTLSVIIPALLLTAVISVLLGVWAAVKGGVVDRIVQFLSIGGTAVPAFIVAIALVFAFAIQWRVFPATGYVKFGENPMMWLASIALPMIALLIGSVASAAQQFRTAVLDTLGRDYVRTLRARGVKEWQVIFQHVLRNAAAPGLTVVGLTLLNLLGGAVFIEQVFALPGIGQLAASSAKIFDVPMVMGTVLFTVLVVLIVNLATDLLITALNPKARKR